MSRMTTATGIRIRTIRLVTATAALLGLAAACAQDIPVVPVRNLERPSDMTFSCVTVTTTGEQSLLSGRPMAECHPPDRLDPLVDLGNRTLGTFGLISNTARGELAVFDGDTGRLVDLDPAVPGYNMVPLGTFPEVMALSQDGCQVVTANRGSCDLNLVDPQRLLSPFFGGVPPSTGAGPVTLRVVPTTASGRKLRAAPQEITFLPQPLSLLSPPTPPPAPRLCSAEGALTAGSERTPWRALITYPGCDLVALVELPSARIISSVYVRPGGLVDAGADPVCPDECGVGVVPRPPVADVDAAVGGGDVDAGPGTDDGGAGPAPVSGPLGIGALALLPDGSRLYVGGARAPFVQAVDIDPQTGLLRAPPDGGQIPLGEGAGGVTRLRLTIDPYQPARGSAYLGRFVGERGEFLYAFARDDSLRVVDVGRRLGPDDNKERECDVAVDPQAVPGGAQELSRGCFPIGAPGFTLPPRRPLARGPGLRIPTVFSPGLPPAVPRDISFAALNLPSPPSDPVIASVTGAFGFLLESTGKVYVVNIDPVTTPAAPPRLSHTIRDFNLGPRAANRFPRLASSPARNFMISRVPLPATVPLASGHGARVEGVLVGDPALNPLATLETPAVTWVVFPDATAAVSQNWNVDWEPLLPGAIRDSGEALGANELGPAGSVRDPGADFCDAGVLARDFLFFPGCLQDSDCQPLGTQVCRQADPAFPGMCFPLAEARNEELLRQCTPQLLTRRRYQILASTPTRLDLALLPDEIPKTSLDLCQTDADCQPGGRDYVGFQCVQVQAGEPRRCVKPCNLEMESQATRGQSTCRRGTRCAAVPGSLAGPLCVEGLPVDPACLPASAPYRVQAGHTFMVNGSTTPSPALVRNVGGQCAVDPNRHHLLVNRIPLDAPACSNIDQTQLANSAQVLGLSPMGPPDAWGNPCLFRGYNLDQTDSTADRPVVKALFQNTELRFILTNLNEYAGDPLNIGVGVVGGFLPDNDSLSRPTDVVLTMGVRILVGPYKSPDSPGSATSSDVFRSFPYMYVVDQGRTVSSSVARGQVLRLNPRSTPYSQPRFDSSFTTRIFQIQ